MQRVRIGILGGCLAAPMLSVGKSQLFHQVAARRLSARGLSARVSLQAFDDYRLEPILASLDVLARSRSCDVLVLQIRPSLLRMASVVVWKDRRAGHRGKVRLSPFYVKDLADWRPPDAVSQTSSFPGINYLIARGTGLLDRGRNQVEGLLRAVAQHARHELRRPLIFLGPMFNKSLPPPLVNFWAPAIAAIARVAGVPLVDLCDFQLRSTPERFEADGFHANPHGHEMIGNRLAETIATILDSTGGSRSRIS